MRAFYFLYVKKTDYEKVVSGVRVAWNDLKNHKYPETQGVDTVSISSFKKEERKNLKEIKGSLQKGEYKFSPLRATYKEKKNSKKKRRLLIGTVSDRIVSKAILNAVGPRLTDVFTSGVNYCPVLRIGNKKKKQKNIQSAVVDIKKAYNDGYVWAFETDIRSFFDEIDKEKLEALIKPHVDVPTYGLLQQIVHFTAHNLDPQEVFKENLGVAQGSSLSPLLANIYLNQFDKVLSSIEDVIAIRYVDDLVVLCRSQKKAESVKETVLKELGKIDLFVNDSKTGILDMGSKPLEFLGIQFTASTASLPKKKREEIEKNLRKVFDEKKYITMTAKLAKAKQVLLANIKYYKSLDMDDFQPQLMSLVDAIEKKACGYFEFSQRKILGKDIYHGMDTESRRKHLEFLGLNFSELKVDVVLPSREMKVKVTEFQG